jgi:hypothetical protein
VPKLHQPLYTRTLIDGLLTFTDNAITPLNGTFSGTITGSGQTQVVTIHVTQDSNFGLTVTGTSFQSGVTSTISISPNSNLPFNTDIRGTFVYANGTATNVNGTSPFQVLAHNGRWASAYRVWKSALRIQNSNQPLKVQVTEYVNPQFPRADLPWN